MKTDAIYWFIIFYLYLLLQKRWFEIAELSFKLILDIPNGWNSWVACSSINIWSRPMKHPRNGKFHWKTIYIYICIYIYIWWHQDDGSLRLQILKYMSRNMSCINLNVKHVPHRTDQTVSVAQRNSLLRCGVELTWSAAGGHRVPSGNWNSYSKWPFIVIVDILIKNGDFPELC